MGPKERIVSKGPLKEVVNYPPHEQQSEYNRQKLAEMELYPSDGVTSYPRSIPFKGSKESFLRKTGRDRFDVFEYRFSAPNVKGEKKQWWVMWDYYNGLVRVHDFFDCCKPGKTEPGNAVREKVNPGLLSVCHNITGGNLHAQGYWIPYEAAKCLAAKFCYRIRYALTIIFGEAFPGQCLPETHPDFGRYQIDPKIIDVCRQKSAAQLCVEQGRLNSLPNHRHHHQQALPLQPAMSHADTLITSRRRLKSTSPPRSNQVYEQYRTRTRTPDASKRYYDPVRGIWMDVNSSSSSQNRDVDGNMSSGGSGGGTCLGRNLSYRDAERGAITIDREHIIPKTLPPPSSARYAPEEDGTERGRSLQVRQTVPPQALIGFAPIRETTTGMCPGVTRTTYTTTTTPPHRKQPSAITSASIHVPSKPPIPVQIPDSDPDGQISFEPRKRPKFHGPRNTRVSAPPPDQSQITTPSRSYRVPERFVLGTFSRQQRLCRSDSFSTPNCDAGSNSDGSCGGGGGCRGRGSGGGGGERSGRERFEGTVAAEKLESLEHVLAVEAAGNLMKLQLDEFNLTFDGGRSGRKRRQSH